MINRVFWKCHRSTHYSVLYYKVGTCGNISRKNEKVKNKNLLKEKKHLYII